MLLLGHASIGSSLKIRSSLSNIFSPPIFCMAFSSSFESLGGFIKKGIKLVVNDITCSFAAALKGWLHGEVGHLYSHISSFGLSTL